MATRFNMQRVFNVLSVLTVAVLIIILLVTTCENSKRLDQLKGTAVLDDSALQRKIRSLRDSLNRERVIYEVTRITNEQLAMSRNQELLNIHSELRRLGLNPKNTHSTTIIETKTTDTLYIHKRDTLLCDGSIGSHTTNLEWKDDWMNLRGSIKFKYGGGMWVLDSTAFQYSIANKLSVNYTFKRRLFKPRSLVLTVMQDNPHTTTGHVQTYVIQNKTMWYEKWWLHQIIGATIGATATYLIMK